MGTATSGLDRYWVQSIKGVYGHVDLSDWCVTLCLCSGRYKTWTLDSGLDYGLDYGLDFGL